MKGMAQRGKYEVVKVRCGSTPRPYHNAEILSNQRFRLLELLTDHSRSLLIVEGLRGA